MLAYSSTGDLLFESLPDPKHSLFGFEITKDDFHKIGEKELNLMSHAYEIKASLR